MKCWPAIVVALAAFGVGCGSDEPAAGPAGPPARAEVQASRGQDRQIGLEVRRYLVYNCPPPGVKLPTRQEYQYPRYYPQYRRLALGTIAVCGSVATIAVEDSRVTIRSGLENDAEGRAAGEAFCNLIQGSDVADFTPGHELQDKEGEAIKVCPARSD